MIKNKDSVWHRPNNEYRFDDFQDEYRIFTNVNNSVYDIWVNGKSIEGDTIALEIEAQRIFDTSNIYGVSTIGFEWNPTEFDRIRELQKKKRS